MKKILYFLLFSFSICAMNRVCRDPSGNEVDWYSIFFMPASISKDGIIDYAYFDPTLNELDYYKYDENTFPPTRITKYITDSDDTNFNYFLWNDDKTVKNGNSSSASSSKAHAKGTLKYDINYGTFLLHSLPRFPTRTSENEVLTELPSNGGSYGQTFLCISIIKETAEIIAELLNYINVSINKSVSSDRVNETPNTWITKLIKNKMSSSYPNEHTKIIYSIAGEEFTFYGKNYKNKIIPFDTTMRENYNDDFYVRTWSRPSLAPAQYDTYKLVNVIKVKYDTFQYEVNKEHSKWGITKDKNIVCFADLNHTESQKDRGGHIVCFENEKLHNIIKNAIISTDEEDQGKDSSSEDASESSSEESDQSDNYKSFFEFKFYLYILYLLFL